MRWYFLRHLFPSHDRCVEMGAEEDKENVRALYEEYGEWLDTYMELEGSDEEYTTAWAPNLTEV